MPGVWIARKGGPLEPETGPATFTDLGKTQGIAPGQNLQIVEVNNEIWVLGVTGSSINLLHRYDRDEWDGPVQPIGSISHKSFFFRDFLKENSHDRASNISTPPALGSEAPQREPSRCSG